MEAVPWPQPKPDETGWCHGTRFADRVSAHRWWANQWRLLLSALAYPLIESVRRLALAGTELAEAICQTIRLKLIKIGTVIERKLTLVRLHFSSSHPLK